MQTVVGYLKNPVGQRLIDADDMRQGNFCESLFDFLEEEYSFLIYMEKIKNGYDILGE